MKLLHNEIYIPTGSGKNFASLYTRITFFYNGDIIGVVLVPSFTD